MGVFNKTPYTNFHELNLNWIIKKIKEVAADNTYFKQFFKTIEDEHILGVVTKVTENNDNTVKTDYLNEDTQQMDNYTAYNKTGTDGAISGAVMPIANRVTTAEGNISDLQDGKVDKTASILINTDINTIKGVEKSGFYYVSSGCTNVPQLYAGLIVDSVDDNVCFQYLQHESDMYIRQYSGNAWSSWQQLLPRTDPVQLISQLGLSTTATSIYSGDWTKYRMLLIEGTQYSNMRNSIIVPISYFSATTNDNRVQLPVPATLDASPSLVWYSIYKTDNTHITIAATSSNSALGIRIYGIM